MLVVDKMNVFHFSQDVRRGKVQLGGFSRLWNLTSDGHSHVVFTVHYGNAETDEFFIDHLRIVSFGLELAKLRWWNRRSAAKRLGREIANWFRVNEIVPDLFFGHSQLFNYSVLRNARRALRADVALLWEANGIRGSALLDGNYHPVHMWQALHQAYVFWTADLVVAQTERCRQTIIKYFRLPRSRVTVVTNAVDPSSVTHIKKYDAPIQPKLVLGFVGLFDALNGAPFVLRMARTLCAHARLRFIGDGASIEQVRRLAAEGVIEYAGPVPYSQMNEELCKLDILLIPRIRCFGSENYIPTKLLEAMAAGVVVLGANVAGISEVLRDGKNGFLFEPEVGADLIEKIEAISAMPLKDLQRVSDSARETIRDQYVWSDRHDVLARAYRSATARSRQSDNRATSAHWA